MLLAGGASSEPQEETLHQNLIWGCMRAFLVTSADEPDFIQVVLHVGASAKGETACTRILKIP